jgi:hypothetical protein
MLLMTQKRVQNIELPNIVYSEVNRLVYFPFFLNLKIVLRLHVYSLYHKVRKGLNDATYATYATYANVTNNISE